MQVNPLYLAPQLRPNPGKTLCSPIVRSVYAIADTDIVGEMRLRGYRNRIAIAYYIEPGQLA